MDGEAGSERESTVQRLCRALRTNLPADPAESRRLFHGRGGCYPGLEALTVDWFAPVALVALHRAEAEPFVDPASRELRTLLGRHLEGVVVQRRYLEGAPSGVFSGVLPPEVFAREAGLRYRLRLGGAQNVGFFLDMANGRALVRRLAPGRRVLNLFAYTCSFSVAALAGGGEQVLNVDMNRGALALGRENHGLNGIDLRRASFLAHDVFKSFGKLQRLGPYDLVVIDPPTDQGRSFSAERDWPRLLRRLPDLARPGADVVACLNSPRLPPSFLTDLFAETRGDARLQDSYTAPPDFPERLPEQGLKILHYRV